MKILRCALLVCLLTTLSTLRSSANVVGANLPNLYRAADETSVFKNLISPNPDSNSFIYIVQKGDTLDKIARKHNVNAEFVMYINQLKTTSLSKGQRLKLPLKKMSVVVDKSMNLLMLKIGEQVLKTYVISTGRDNSTPVGTFKVINRLKNPTWYKDGKAIAYGSPGHELGTRWIGISKKSYGIHGTIEPEKLGYPVSHGCVRMSNEDVEDLFNYLSHGNEVTIVE